MAQHDYVIANGTGAAVRSDLNNALAAIVSQNSGATEPATMYAYQWWADTTTGLLKLRNGANNAWITLRELDGTLTIEDGTAGAPGLAFADDLNTGVFSPGADQVAFTAGGTARLTATTTGITSALPVDVPLGSASAPTVTFTGDLNTGIYSPGADQVAVATNGTGRLFVDSSGRVLVGTSSSRDVASGGPSIVQIEGSSFRHLSMVQNSNDDNGVTLAFGKSRGTSAGGTTIVQNNDDIARLRFAGANGSDVATVAAEIRCSIDGTPGTSNDMPGRLSFATSADGSASPTERMRITSAGLVGIGVTSPSDLLHNNGNIRVSWGSFRVASVFDNSFRQGMAFDTGNRQLQIFSTTSDTGGSIGFFTRSTAGSSDTDYGTEKVRIDVNGRLLVGTSSARGVGSSYSFPIQNENTTAAGATFVTNSNDTESSYLVLGKSRGTSIGANTIVQANDVIGRITFAGADGTDLETRAATIEAQVDGTPGTNDMPGRLVFSTTADGASSPTERMRIFSDGNARFSNLTDVYPTTDNAVRLGASGLRWSEVWAANGTIQTSDERAKVNIAEAILGSDFIKSLRPVSFRWVEGGKRDTGERDENNNYIYESVPGERTHWGFIAQEVKQAVDAAGVDFGGWVLTDKDNPDSQQALRYDQFIAPLTKALQEAIAKIETLEAKVAALEGA